MVADTPYLDRLPNVDFTPVFILGDHRSGTTLLYKILTMTGCFNFVKAYHIIKYDEILSNHIDRTEERAIQELETLFRSLGIGDRGIDRVRATPELPEEYGFILKNIAGDEPRITPDNLPIFRQLCQKIQSVSDADKPLLLKNPWDLSNFLYIKSVFPSARFIFIHRHPIPVINSKLKAVRTLLSSWNPYTDLISREYTRIFKNPARRYFYRFLYSRYPGVGFRRVTRGSVESTTYFLKNIESLSDRDYFSIKYEDLCKDPETNICQILDFLKLELKAKLDYSGSIERPSLNLLPEVRRKSPEICQKLQPYLTFHDYNSSGPF